MGKKARNTNVDRMCPDCQGTGAVDLPHANPQFDSFETCSNKGCVDGWIRFAPIDPLEQLKQARQHARSSWGALQYGRLRMRAMSPVCLPLDRPSLERLISSVERARDAFRWAA